MLNNTAVIQTEVVVGNGLSVSGVIIDFADKEKTDLIVLGNVGLSGLSKVKALGRPVLFWLYIKVVVV